MKKILITGGAGLLVTRCATFVKNIQVSDIGCATYAGNLKIVDIEKRLTILLLKGI
jgi:hypothetical protein